MSEHTQSALVKSRLCTLYDDLIAHDGFGEIRVEIRLLKRGQKEVILHCGKQYRFVVDCAHVLARWRKEVTDDVDVFL
jgi:hypothetical protein